MHTLAQTPRFSIREFKPEEEAIYLDLFEDERVNVHLPKRGRKERENIFQNTLKEYASHSVLGTWGLFDNTDGDFIGLCLLRNYHDEDGKIELGYVLHQKYWGKGIASDMAIIMVGYGFIHTDAREIVGITTLGNTGSQKVLEKAGMTRMDNFKRDGEELAYFRVQKNKT